MVGTVNEANYQGAATNTLVIGQATPTATLAVNNSPVTYDGTAKSATVAVSTSSTAGSVANIRTGGAASQTAAGTYAVTADFVPANTNFLTLTAQAAGNFVIGQATATVTLASLQSTRAQRERIQRKCYELAGLAACGGRGRRKWN